MNKILIVYYPQWLSLMQRERLFDAVSAFAEYWLAIPTERNDFEVNECIEKCPQCGFTRMAPLHDHALDELKAQLMKAVVA